MFEQTNTTYARGFGISIATVGMVSSFTVLAKDEYGNEPFAGVESLTIPSVA